jgi:hypothetical protein
MPITPFLRGQAFDPEAVKAMGIAFTDSCQALGLVERTDKLTELVADRIIELAQQGIRDAAALTAMVLKEFAPG